jgi:anti-anti-sigma regulatory factor
MQSPKSTQVSLPVNLTIRAAATTHAQLLEALETNDETVIALEDDAHIDTSFIQMLEAARAYAKANNKQVSLLQPASAELLDILRRAGFLDGMSDEDAQFYLHQGNRQ